MANVSKPAAAAPVAPDRWRQQVRLECVKAATARVVSAHVAYDADAIIAMAAKLEKFVFSD